MIKLGSKARCKVTGYEGIVTGRTDFLNGCTRVGLQAKAKKDGTVPDMQWFDEPQLEEIGKVDAKLLGGKKTGGPMVSVPTRNQYR